MLPDSLAFLCVISAESLRKSESESFRLDVNSLYLAPISSAGRRPRGPGPHETVPSTLLISHRIRSGRTLLRPLRLNLPDPPRYTVSHDYKYRNLPIPGGSSPSPGADDPFPVYE